MLLLFMCQYHEVFSNVPHRRKTQLYVNIENYKMILFSCIKRSFGFYKDLFLIDSVLQRGRETGKLGR